jgi:predicted KAP-like P-loop ATPase
MLIRPKKLAIDPSNPFALDKLNRLESATILTQLIERADTPLVLGLDAKWGNGKTTFLQMWQHHLSARGIQSMYFNAWESDYSDDPLISFIGEMGAQIKGHQNNKQSRRLKKSWELVKEKGATLAKRIVPVGLKVATAGILDLDYVSEQALANLAADIAKDKIENYLRDKNDLPPISQTPP